MSAHNTLALDEGGNIDTIYLDFAKAFDTVPHQRLLMKLRGYGIGGRILTWIEAFLTDRRQRVGVNDSRSSWADVTSGIPQGSVLGPMLFIIYINDMPSSVLSSIYLFADDAKVYRNISSNDDPPTLQHDLQQLEKWSERWQLRFKGPATRNDLVNDIVDDARADAIFATLKTIVDDIVTCGRALTQTSVRSCTSVGKTPVKTTPWAEQRWLQQPARRTFACTSTQN